MLIFDGGYLSFIGDVYLFHNGNRAGQQIRMRREYSQNLTSYQIRPAYSLAGTRMRSIHKELSIEMEPAGISIWTKPWSNRFARVTLLVDFGDKFAVVVDPRSGFWFLPGGGVEQNESIEEAAEREAFEELGLRVNASRVIATFDVTLASKDTREHLKIPLFVVVLATPTGGQLKKKYAPNRKILLVRTSERNTLPQDLKAPAEFEWMKPYICISREVVQEFIR